MSQPLSEAKKGEIALKYLKHLLRREGIKLSENTKREIANTAKKTRHLRWRSRTFLRRDHPRSRGFNFSKSIKLK